MLDRLQRADFERRFQPYKFAHNMRKINKPYSLMAMRGLVNTGKYLYNNMLPKAVAAGSAFAGYASRRIKNYFNPNRLIYNAAYNYIKPHFRSQNVRTFRPRNRGFARKRKIKRYRKRYRKRY